MIDNVKIGELVLYALGLFASLGATTVVSTYVAMSVKGRFDKKKVERGWSNDKKDRRNGSYEELKEKARQSEEKHRTLFGVYVPKIERNEVKVAVLETQLSNILNIVTEIRRDLRNGHGK